LDTMLAEFPSKSVCCGETENLFRPAYKRTTIIGFPAGNLQTIPTGLDSLPSD